MTAIRIALFSVSICAVPAVAQPKTGKVQPDKLALGTVYTGSIVEASFKVFEAGKDPKIKLEVTAPKFIKVLSKETNYQQFGAGNDFVCGEVEIAIDTTAAADHSGEIAVTLGDTKVKLSVSATVKANKKSWSRVLIAETPFHSTATDDGRMFQPWTDLVASSPLNVSYLLVKQGKPVLRDLVLSKFDTVFLSGTGLVFMTDSDVKKVREFAEAGGRVVVSANYFFRGTVKHANSVLTGYGIEMLDQEARGMGQNDVTLGKDDFDRRLVKDGIESANFFRASPVRVTDDRSGRVLAKAVGVGEAIDGFIVVAKAGKGEVIAIGESLWWYWLSKERAKGTDNAKILRWLLVPSGGA